MAKYNAVLNFGGNRKEVTDGLEGLVVKSNAFIIKIDMDTADYDESDGQVDSGHITFHLLNGNGENIVNFTKDNAIDEDDGGITVSLSGGLG